MTRGELGKLLNTLLETVDQLSDRFSNRRRIQDRLNTIRDQVVLLALDLGLPVQPVKEEQPKPIEAKGDGEADGPPGQTG